MKSRYHFLVSLPLSISILFQKNIPIAFLCMLVGWLVDADHEIDHFIYTKRFVINPFKLGNELTKQWSGKLYIPLHGWEILYLIIIASSVFNFSFLVATAYFFHLVMDIIGNDIKLLEMSILVRWSRNWVRRLPFQSINL